MCGNNKNSWESLLDALDDTYGTEQSADELHADLKSRGIDPDRLVASVQRRVAGFLGRQDWREQAAAKRKRFLTAAVNSACSWLNRTGEEIEAGVAAALRGDRGHQVQAAFRGRTGLTTEDKAKILDEYDRLRQFAEGTNDRQEPETR